MNSFFNGIKSMKITTQEIATLLNATLEGDPNILISGLSRIEKGEQGTLTFLANTKYTQHIYNTGASAVLVSSDFVGEKPISATLIRTDDPYAAFSLLLEKFNAAILDKKGVHPLAFVSETAQIGVNVYIGAFAFVGENAEIGDYSKIYPSAYVGDHAKIGHHSTLFSNVSLYHGCRIGNHCRIHSGTVIGADGFGFVPTAEGTLKKVPQTGIVLIEDEVEIGANCAIDRATLGETILRKGVKIDNLVQLAHNVEIGSFTVVAAQSGVSGSSKLGAGCMIGGQVGIVGHIELADGIKVGAQSGVSKSFTDAGKVLRGSPAQGLRDQLKAEAMIRQLGQMADRITELEKKLAKFEA